VLIVEIEHVVYVCIKIDILVVQEDKLEL